MSHHGHLSHHGHSLARIVEKPLLALLLASCFMRGRTHANRFLAFEMLAREHDQRTVPLIVVSTLPELSDNINFTLHGSVSW